jgi:hypothetical protein
MLASPPYPPYNPQFAEIIIQSLFEKNKKFTKFCGDNQSNPTEQEFNPYRLQSL